MEIKIGNSAEYLIIDCPEDAETKAVDDDFYNPCSASGFGCTSSVVANSRHINYVAS